MKYSIVITTYNHLEDCLKPCINSIIKYTNLSDTEVIISAGGCKEDTKEYVKSLGIPFKLVWEEKGLGYTKAINAGIKEAIGEYLILLADDTLILANNWIDLLVKPFSDSKVGITGPVKFYLNCGGRKEGIASWCTMIKKSVFDKIGLFDEVFSPFSCEDIEFSFRAVKNGYKLVQVPTDKACAFLKEKPIMDFPIYHKGSATTNIDKEKKKKLDIRNMGIIRSKYGIKYSIVIPTYNHLEDCLKPCIESIIKYTDLDNIEIIVSANGCKDGTKEYIESLGEHFKLVWKEEATGFSQAVNDGILVSIGEYIILLNNDVVLLDRKKNEWLEMLVKPFVDSTVGITGPLLGPSAPAGGHDFLIFFCVMVKREVINKIGLLDLAFGVGGGEDTDFCIKAKKAGYKLVQVPEQPLNWGPHFMGGFFPIYHKGEATVKDENCVSNWNEIFERNTNILRERYAKV